MPLEFTAIAPQDSDTNESVAAIPLQAHDYIMLTAHNRELKLLLRMAEYWEDTVYESGELEQLRMELSQVRDQLSPQEPDAERMAELVARMDSVIAKAQEIGGYVEAIAD
jgi:hypothetical protein